MTVFCWPTPGPKVPSSHTTRPMRLESFLLALTVTSPVGAVGLVMVSTSPLVVNFMAL